MVELICYFVKNQFNKKDYYGEKSAWENFEYLFSINVFHYSDSHSIEYSMLSVHWFENLSL